MKTLKLIGMVPLVLVAAATTFGQGDDRAVPRTGSSSSGSDAGSRHAGGSSSASSSGGSSSSDSNRGGSSWNSGDQSSRSSDAAARRPRPGTGSGTRDRYGSDRDSYRSYPNSYYYYDPYYYSWGYGRRPYGLYGYGYGYYDYGYSYGDYYGYYPSSYSRSYRYRAGNIAQIRTLVEPAKARVYVDGYYAGIVDDFDGLLQRLNVSPGRHEITLKLEGYKSHTFAIYANRDQTLKLRWDMERGSGETRDTAADYDRAAARGERELDRDDDETDENENRDSARVERDRSREVDAEPADRPYTPPSRDAGRGVLEFQIEPADASVYIDGEFFGKASQMSRVDLPPGRHRIEVVRPGYKTEEAEVEVGGDAKKVVVKLERR
jgi:PEGA domain